MAKHNPIEIESHDGLVTVKGTNACLGYLVNFHGHGVYDATYGRVDVSPEQADAHNRVFDKMLVEGLDRNCQVGQHGVFYWHAKPRQVRTFLGTVIADKGQLSPSGKAISFVRNGKTFRGRIRTSSDLIVVRRTA